MIKKVEPRQKKKIVLPTKYYRKHYTFDILYIFQATFILCSFSISKFPIDA